MANPRQGPPAKWGNQPRYGEFEIAGAREGKPRLLGEGSFGKTFEGIRSDTVAGGVIQDHVAIKVLSPDLLSSEAKRFQFIQELVALTKFKHSNLIHYIRCGEENGEVYYAMELCRGGDLAKLVRRYGPLPERVAALIGAQVANGLKEVHVRHRLVHRDIKPSNIMLVDELEQGLSLQHLGFRIEEQESLCRIVDFGLVDFTINAQDGRQRFVGSPMYASPEQIREQPVDGRSDIYSLGMTLWYLVQGKGPLLNADGEELKDMRQAMERHTLEAEFEADFPPHLSAEFRRILSRAVAKRPELRYSTAAEFHRELQEYLKTAPEEVTAPPAFTVNRLNGPLETAYVIDGMLSPRGSHKCYLAREKEGGREVRLTVVSHLDGPASPATEALAQQLCEMGEISAQSTCPAALLPVTDVVFATDTLAYAELLPPHVELAEVLRARAANKRPLGFNEAYLILRPIAEALDYMMQQRRESIYLPCEDIWLSAGNVTGNPHDTRVLTRPMGEWQDLQVYFSVMWLPPGTGEAERYSPQQTMSGSMQMSEADMHPAPTFARLVYRILNGSEVAAAAQFTPNAYVPAVTLGHVSNNLLRDIICNMRPRTNATTILKELCADGGVIWRAAGASATATTMRTATHRTAGASASGGSAMHRSSFGSTRSASASGSAAKTRGIPATGSTASGSASRSTQRTPPPSAQQSQFGASRSYLGAPAGGSIGPRDGDNPASRSVNIPAGATIGPRPAGDEKICEVVSPGIVRSPYDPEKRDQEVPTDQWAPSGPVRCSVSGRVFRLPRKLSSLPARVLRPGLIQSPHATPGATQTVPWDEWLPGAEIVCVESGKRVALPIDLPLPEGILPPEGTGTILSPYPPNTPIAGPPEHWEPQATVLCPTTLWNFALPAQLPALEALVDAGVPGQFATPYNPSTVWTLPPSEWAPGNTVECPVTKKPLTIPSAVESWPADAVLNDAVQRLIENPFIPGELIEVAATEWAPGALVPCPVTGRAIRLPANLPRLTGELTPGRPGTVRSPFTGEQVALQPADWTPGAEVVCPQTRLQFLLPSALPEWAVETNVSNPAQREVFNPFRPGSTVTVPAASWYPGARVPCPVTGRTMLLPANLPPLEAELAGRPGTVRSPFSGEEVRVEPENWFPTAKIQCPKSNLQFVLPAGLPEWTEEAKVANVSQRLVENPFRPGSTVQVAAATWYPGARVPCPVTGLTIVLPANLPPLQGELVPGHPGEIRSPYSGDIVPVAPVDWTAAGEVKCPKTNARFVLPPELPEWVVETKPVDVAKRLVENPYRPGSPMEVPAASWAPGARISCPETGRPILLPANLPPLEATAGERPGVVRSPYSGEIVPVAPERWIPGGQVTCPKTNRPFVLPKDLPEWTEVCTVADVAQRRIANPFRPGETVQLAVSMWYPGARVPCPATGRTIILPPDLPRLLGELIPGHPGEIKSPFSGDVVSVAPADWTAGGEVKCPKTNAPFVLPPELPEWVVETKLVDLAKRLVENPYRPGSPMEVSAASWAPGARICCPETRRPILLPANLPLLEATLGERPGLVRSPYSGELVPVVPERWVAGGQAACPKTNRPFVLPKNLPEWTEVCTVTDVAQRRVTNPFRPGETVQLAVSMWYPGARVPCPATGRTIILPPDLPRLRGETIPSRPGSVVSPYTGETISVPPAEWEGGHEVHCPKANATFLLPDKLPEWTEEAFVASVSSRTVKNPFAHGATVEVPAAKWRPGERIPCPVTGRTIVLPADLPPLEADLLGARLGSVRSPYSGETVSIAPEKWVAGQRVACPKAKLDFVLPANLPEWVEPGSVVDLAKRLVSNPFRPGAPVEVPAASWIPGGRVKCPDTACWINLPADLPRLHGELIPGRPGSVRSPFSGQIVPVAPADWVPGGEVVCPASRLEFVLPPEVPVWEVPATVVDVTRRLIANPFRPGTTVEVPASVWRPGEHVPCPATGRPILLPDDLPPLRGEAMPGVPGSIRSPYTGDPVSVPPEDWMPGAEATCPKTKARFVLPDALPEWAQEGKVANGRLRLVTNPFRPGTSVEVPVANWYPGARVPCPTMGHTILLPADLPPLEGDVDAGTPGTVRSPYTGEAIAVEPSDWLPGTAVVCPKTGHRFVLPTPLPEWVPFGTVGRPGVLTSPFKPFQNVTVPAAQWAGGQVVKCPATGRSFRAPETLPMLEGMVEPGRAGWVTSPYTSKPQEVELDDWTPGRQLECAGTKRKFAMPAELEEWVMDAQWVPGFPGRVRSPYKPYVEVELRADQWKPRALVLCPATNRHFRVPLQNAFSSLELEKAAVAYALAEPQHPEADACAFLKEKHLTATPAQVREIWKRHRLDTPAKRAEATQPGEAIAGEPGFVRSPFGARPKLAVPPELYSKPGSFVTCPETGRSFRLPADLPPLIARIAGQPGKAFSPFQPEEAFDVPIEEWKAGGAVRCPATGQKLVLPDSLPEWILVARVHQDQPGVAFSPYGRHLKVDVCGADWFEGARITCPETGNAFALPGNLPLMTGAVKGLGVVTSPYEIGCEVRVPQPEWKSSATVVCPATKRPFVLPDNLPVWEAKKFPVALVAIAAAVVLLAGGGAVAFGLLGGKKTTGDAASPTPVPTPKPVVVVATPSATPAPTAAQTPVAVVATPTPAPTLAPPTPAPAVVVATPKPTPIPTPKPPAAPPQLVFEGGLKIQEWTRSEPPKGLKVLYRKKALDCQLRKTGSEPGTFVVSATLPIDANEDADCVIDVQLPGWKTLRQKPKPNEKGDFVLTTLKTMERSRLPLAVSIPPLGTDYSFIRAEWLGANADETEATLSGTGAQAGAAVAYVRLPVVGGESDRTLPTGVFRLVLEGENLDAPGRIKPFTTGTVTVTADAELPPQKIPETVADDIWGLFVIEQGGPFGTFFHCAFDKKAAAVTISEFSLPRAATFTMKDCVSGARYAPQPGQIWKVDAKSIQLTAPGVLEFDCPIYDVPAHWVYRAEAFPRYWSAEEPSRKEPKTIEIFPTLPPNLRSIVAKAVKEKRGTPAALQAALSKLREADIEVLRTQVPSGYKETARYKNYLASDDLYRKRFLVVFDTLNLFESLFKTKDFVWFRLFPSQTLLYRTGVDDNWDVDDKAPLNPKPAGQP